jgi:hypothetical protein
MAGVVAIATALLAFLVPLAIPLFAQRWRSFLVILGLAVLFFAWLTWDLQRTAPDGNGHWLGAFLGGLMLTGFAAGAIAKFVMLVGRRPEPPRGES